MRGASSGRRMPPAAWEVKPVFVVTRSKLRVIATFGLAATVTGCLVVNEPAAPQASVADIAQERTETAALKSGIPSEDAQIITQTVADAPDGRSTRALAWTNPDTGSSGTIVAIDQFLGQGGRTCRNFRTSVDTFMGIAFYDGEACQVSPSDWVLSWFRTSDG